LSKQSIIEGKITRHQALTFDDILLLPNYTEIKREDVSLVSILHPSIVLKLPILSSPMDTVTEGEMAIAMAKAGGLGVIHRNLSVAKQAGMVREVKKQRGFDKKISTVDKHGKLLVAAAVGVGSDLDERALALVEAGVDVLCVDSAHGYSKFVLDVVTKMRKKYRKVPIMAGNVATYDGTRALIEAGADIIRVGMGPGSICTTRIVTGMGVPQISAVAAAVRATDGTKATVVADGGIRQIGDMAKAFAFGAGAVMLGTLLAGYAESPGKVVRRGNKKYKQYRGMGSVAAMREGTAERYGQTKTTEVKKLIPEGVEGLVPYKGSVGDYLYQVIGSLHSSFFYLGAPDLKTFFEISRVIKISMAGLLESHPHEVSIVDAGTNYRV
jgi:IMP dehydrogenase